MTKYYAYIKKKAARGKKIDINTFLTLGDVLNSSLCKEDYVFFPDSAKRQILNKYKNNIYRRIEISGDLPEFPTSGRKVFKY